MHSSTHVLVSLFTVFVHVYMNSIWNNRNNSKSTRGKCRQYVCCLQPGAVHSGSHRSVPRVHISAGSWSSVWAGAGLIAGVDRDSTWPDPCLRYWQVCPALQVYCCCFIIEKFVTWDAIAATPAIMQHWNKLQLCQDKFQADCGCTGTCCCG